MLYADDMCMVSGSPRGLKRRMAVFVGVFGAFGLTTSERKMEIMYVPIPPAPATQIVENDLRTRAGWMSFRRTRGSCTIA